MLRWRSQWQWQLVHGTTCHLPLRLRQPWGGAYLLDSQNPRTFRDRLTARISEESNERRDVTRQNTSKCRHRSLDQTTSVYAVLRPMALLYRTERFASVSGLLYAARATPRCSCVGLNTWRLQVVVATGSVVRCANYILRIVEGGGGPLAQHFYIHKYRRCTH